MSVTKGGLAAETSATIKILLQNSTYPTSHHDELLLYQRKENYFSQNLVQECCFIKLHQYKHILVLSLHLNICGKYILSIFVLDNGVIQM